MSSSTALIRVRQTDAERIKRMMRPGQSIADVVQEAVKALFFHRMNEGYRELNAREALEKHEAVKLPSNKEIPMRTEKELEHYFKYHPPITQERKDAHDRINAAALEFAKAVQANVKDEDCAKMAFFSIQQARMFANQGATLDEVLHAQGQCDETTTPAAE